MSSYSCPNCGSTGFKRMKKSTKCSLCSSKPIFGIELQSETQKVIDQLIESLTEKNWSEDLRIKVTSKNQKEDNRIRI